MFAAGACSHALQPFRRAVSDVISPHRVVWLGVLALAISGACRTTPSRSPFAAADSVRAEGRARQAAGLYRALRDSFVRAGDSAGAWRAELWWGDGLMNAGRPDSAGAVFDTALRWARGDPDREGWSRVERSALFQRAGQFDSGLAEASRARDLAQAVRDLPLEADAYHMLGENASLTGRYRDALAADERVLLVRREAKARPADIATALSELGINYRHLGRYGEATAAYEEALAIDRKLGNPEGIARVLFNLSNVRAATGDEAGALAALTEARHYAAEIKNPRGLGFIEDGLGELYATAGNRAAARAHFAAARDIDGSSGNVYGLTGTLENLGRLAIAEGQLVAAHAALDSALALADAKGYGRDRGMIRAALARLAAAEGRRAAAERWSAAALRLADSIGDPEVQLEALEARGRALETRRPGSPAPYLAAIDLLESVRGRLALGDLRMGVAELHLPAYEGAIRVLLERGEAGAAFAVAERARARLLLELMSEGEGARSARSQADTVREALRERFEGLSDARSGARAALEHAIDSLAAAATALEAEARRADPAAGLRFPAARALGELRSGLVGPGRAVLAYFWGDSAVFGWWIGEGPIEGTRLGRADSLEALVEFLRGALERPEAGLDWRPAALEAYRALVAPLVTRPQALPRGLYLVPDGPLAYLPFEVLVPAAGAPPLGATHELAYGPSVSVLWALAHPAARPPPERALLALGNPLAESAASGRGRAAPDRAPLPYAEAEAQDIYELFRAQGADLLLGARATRARWLDRTPGRYRYLHFATHAEARERPGEVALELADGPLDLAAIRSLRLGAELVTLSACETALGPRVRGEGIVGLPHAFLAAGARGAVVSLWRVDDRATALFMHDFYAALIRGEGPAAALRAVRAVRASGGGTPPVDWAAFVFVGALE